MCISIKSYGNTILNVFYCYYPKSRFFADESLLHREICNTNDSIQLQEDLNALESWEKKWLMRFNPSKYNVISIPPKNKAVI